MIILQNLVDEEYEPLKTYFPDEEVLFVGEDNSEAYRVWGYFLMERWITKENILELF